jgi:hypothetical protein
MASTALDQLSDFLNRSASALGSQALVDCLQSALASRSCQRTSVRQRLVTLGAENF